MKYKFEDVYYIGNISNHNDIKGTLLEKIKNSESTSIVNEEYTITKTDWPYCYDTERDWANYFINNCIEDIKKFYNDLGHEKFTINNVWFQQYSKNSSHEWHNHARCNYSNVYFLELPEKSLATEVLLPYSNEKKVLEAKEGEMLIFPAHIYHRSPINLDDMNRTVLVFNSNLE